MDQPHELTPPQAARAAGLRYVDDDRPGISRRKAGKGFAYTMPDGARADAETRARIKALGIPPAWREVWICPHPRGHIQAVGRDEKGRKQYRYHAEWRAARDAAKFHRLLAFGDALPGLRERVEADLGRRGLVRERVLALVVRLLETTLIRVGNEEYARSNKSYGLTTLRDRHAEVGSTKIRFEFRGKGGKWHQVELRDRRLARAVRACQDLPGQLLFQYVDDDGTRHGVESADVNQYLREITGEEFTAKDFRTWAGTVLAAWALREFQAFDSAAKAKRNITTAINRVAGQLGNTPAICRRCYVHPEVFDAYLDGTLLDHLAREVEKGLRERLAGLRSEEAAVYALLHQRLTREVQDARQPQAAQ